MTTPLDFSPRFVIGYVVIGNQRLPVTMAPEFYRAMQAVVRRIGGAAADDAASEFADILAPLVLPEMQPEMVLQPLPAEVSQLPDISQPAPADSPLAFETTYQG